VWGEGGRGGGGGEIRGGHGDGGGIYLFRGKGDLHGRKGGAGIKRLA